MVLVTAFGSSAAAVGPQSASVVPNAKLKQLRAAVLQVEKVPVFKPNGPAIDASAARGTKMMVMPSNSSIAYCSDIAKGVAKLGKTLGISVTNISTNGTPSAWGSGLLQSITAGANASGLICGIPPAVVGPQLQVAKQHHTSVVFDQSWDIGAPFHIKTPTGTYQTGVPNSLALRRLVDMAVVANKGKPFHSLIMTSNDIYIAKGIQAATIDELKKDCGSACKYTVRDIPIADWATKTQSTVASALTKDPQINSIFIFFSGMTVTGGLAAAQGVHRPGLHIYQWGAGAGDLKQMETQSGNIISGDIGCGSAWSSYVLMDQMLRLVLNKPAVNPRKGACAMRLFTRKTVGQYFKNGGFGTSFVKGYDKLWGLK